MALDERLVASFDSSLANKILNPLRWLVPQGSSQLLVTAIGDVFVTHRGGDVWHLDLGGGRYAPVASDVVSFRNQASQASNRESWFAPNVVDALVTAGLKMGAGQCFCFRQLPMLGGKYEPSNFIVKDVVTHFRIWGPILKGIWNLPDGAKIVFREVP